MVDETERQGFIQKVVRFRVWKTTLKIYSSNLENYERLSMKNQMQQKNSLKSITVTSNSEDREPWLKTHVKDTDRWRTKNMV